MTERQAAGTGRRSPGAFGLTPSESSTSAAPSAVSRLLSCWLIAEALARGAVPLPRWGVVGDGREDLHPP